MTGKRPASLAFMALAFFVAACGGSDSSIGASAGNETEPAEVAESSETTEAAAIAGLEGEFATVDGTTIDLATLQGEDVVLWFWAPW